MNPQFMLEVSVDDQCLVVSDAGRVLATYPVSTAARGVGNVEGSFRTPLGRFRIAEKLGADAAIGTIFKDRIPVGRWQPGDQTSEDLVLTRILRLDGLDPDNANTMARCIYIHGTNREDLIGSPASHGCIRMHHADLVELFDLVPEETPLVIHPPTRPRGRLFFVDCDSTLSAIEGIDELARARGDEVFAEVAGLTDAAMNGEIPLDEVFGRRIGLIRPDAAACETVTSLYLATIMPGMRGLIAGLKERGWQPVIVSGGFAPLIKPLAASLGIDAVEAVPLYLNPDGSYAGYGEDYPTTRNRGKNEVIREWRRAMLPGRVVMMGDGVSDLETKDDVDMFIGYGGVVVRDKVRAGADLWLGREFDCDDVLKSIEDGTPSMI